MGLACRAHREEPATEPSAPRDLGDVFTRYTESMRYIFALIYINCLRIISFVRTMLTQRLTRVERVLTIWTLTVP